MRIAWVFRVYDGLEATARLRSLEIDLPLAEAFAGVEFPPPADEPSMSPPPPLTDRIGTAERPPTP